MYTSFYKLNRKPFQISSDPAFIWLGEKHREALSTLKYGVFDNKGFMLLTGDVGTGKTTLINTLIESLGSDVYYASVPDPRLDLGDFLNYIGQAFHIDEHFETKGAFLLHFGWFLEAAYKQDKKVLLIVDEAQLLTQSLLEEIRLLSNIHRDGNHLLNIFFVGQNEFNDILSRPENRAVAQRLTLNYQISPLTLKEIDQYIRHRLKVAGGRQMLFDQSAVKEIYHYSHGIPRRINIICDHCLLTGFVDEKPVIDGNIVTDSAKDIEIPRFTRPAEKPQQPQVVETIMPAPLEPEPTSPQTKPGKSSHLLLIPSLLISTVFAALIALFFLVPDQFVSIYERAGHYLESRVGPLRPAQSVQVEDIRQPPSAVTDNSAAIDNNGAEHVDNKRPTTVPSSIDGSDPSAHDQGDGQESVDAPSSQRAETPGADSQSFDGKTEEISNRVVEIPGNVVETKENPPVQPVIEELPPLPDETIVIRFDSDSNDFNAADREILTDLAETVKRYPDRALSIVGYTDAIGSGQYNIRLSLFRANMIKSFFLGQGVLPKQLRVEGRGSVDPIADNNTETGRRQNRRVEIEVVGP